MRATCWVIPKTIWNRFADQPANSLCARLGAEALDGLPAVRYGSTGSSIKAGTSMAILAGYQSTATMSIVDRTNTRLRLQIASRGGLSFHIMGIFAVGTSGHSPGPAVSKAARLAILWSRTGRKRRIGTSSRKSLP